jgi:multiple sugar transport system ATP-binding protein
MVTHDQAEAMTLADRIVVFNDRKIQQVAAPMEIYFVPPTSFVAQFVGSPAMTILPAAGRRRRACGGDARRRLADRDAGAARGLPQGGAASSSGLRPEHVRVAPGRAPRRRGGAGRAAGRAQPGLCRLADGARITAEDIRAPARSRPATGSLAIDGKGGASVRADGTGFHRPAHERAGATRRDPGLPSSRPFSSSTWS